MENYGKNGKSDYSKQQGRVNIIADGKLNGVYLSKDIPFINSLSPK